MRNALLMIALVAVLPASSVAAEQRRTHKSGKPNSAARQLPPKGLEGNSCAAYGPGFVKVDGTRTCLKLGGAVSVGVGGSR